MKDRKAPPPEVEKILADPALRAALAAVFREEVERSLKLAEGGRRGGQATSPKKAEAARANGRLGGRPRKRQPS